MTTLLVLGWCLLKTSSIRAILFSPPGPAYIFHIYTHTHTVERPCTVCLAARLPTPAAVELSLCFVRKYLNELFSSIRKARLATISTDRSNSYSPTPSWESIHSTVQQFAQLLAGVPKREKEWCPTRTMKYRSTPDDLWPQQWWSRTPSAAEAKLGCGWIAVAKTNLNLCRFCKAQSSHPHMHARTVANRPIVALGCVNSSPTPAERQTFLPSAKGTVNRRAFANFCPRFWVGREVWWAGNIERNGNFSPSLPKLRSGYRFGTILSPSVCVCVCPFRNGCACPIALHHTAAPHGVRIHLRGWTFGSADAFKYTWILHPTASDGPAPGPAQPSAARFRFGKTPSRFVAARSPSVWDKVYNRCEDRPGPDQKKAEPFLSKPFDPDLPPFRTRDAFFGRHSAAHAFRRPKNPSQRRGGPLANWSGYLISLLPSHFGTLVRLLSSGVGGCNRAGRVPNGRVGHPHGNHSGGFCALPCAVCVCVFGAAAECVGAPAETFAGRTVDHRPPFLPGPPHSGSFRPVGE